MSGEGATLAVSQFRLLQLRHAAMTAGIERKGGRQSNLVTHFVNDLLHSAERIGFGRVHIDLTQDHRDATPRQFGKHRFSVCIECSANLVNGLLQRMPNLLASFVVLYADGVGPFLAAIVCPSDVPGQHIFRPL
jgi:hypothetical protein